MRVINIFPHLQNIYYQFIASCGLFYSYRLWYPAIRPKCSDTAQSLVVLNEVIMLLLFHLFILFGTVLSVRGDDYACEYLLVLSFFLFVLDHYRGFLFDLCCFSNGLFCFLLSGPKYLLVNVGMICSSLSGHYYNYLSFCYRVHLLVQKIK